MPHSLRVSAFPVLLLLMPSLAQGQAEQRAMYELPTLSIEIAQNTPMGEQAMALFEQGKWDEAARLYRDAADGLADNSVEAYQAYDLAARLYFYGHDYGSARAMMERAATVAQATGDVVSAAYRHIDAAFIAVWEGYPGSRRDHVEAAERLSADPGMSAEHAARIKALIHGVRALPVEQS